MVDKRKRDPEAKRRALLAAGLDEFSSAGLAGARTSRIAARAGVNKQLISHYFGGKRGLYDALLESWLADEAELAAADVSLGELAASYVRRGREHRPVHRLLLRASLDGEERGAGLTEEDLADLERRQAAGAIAAELDARFVLLALRAMASLTLMFPADVRRLLGEDAGSDAVAAWHAEQLERLVDRLR